MRTRSITTARHAVSCDVCGRNLLRGEHPDAFLADGQRRMVCDLCVARATHEGWLREADGHAGGPLRPRGNRARSLVGRLRRLRESQRREADQTGRSTLADEGTLAAGAQPRHPRGGESPPATDPELEYQLRGVRAFPTNAELKAERALEVFNAGDAPRRVSGVARALGAPTVVVRSQPGGSLVSIVVAWELCWYRYEVDLAEEEAGARLVAEGSELEQLGPDERVANVVADELGELQPLGVA